jgi:hypothetical protein
MVKIPKVVHIFLVHAQSIVFRTNPKSPLFVDKQSSDAVVAQARRIIGFILVYSE